MIPSPLVDAPTLRAQLDDVVVLDARTGPDAAAAYEADHVRRAIRVELETDLSSPADPARGGRHPLPVLSNWLARLGDWGIGRDTPVVIYDAASGGMAAARAWWMLRAVGHERVAVVDGGWRALVEAEIPRDSEVRPIGWVGPYPSSISRWPTVDAEQVERVRRDREWRLVDARAPERYNGEVEPLDPIAGRIPGAANLFWKSLLGADGRFAPRGELARRYHDVCGSIRPDRVICYCGSGVTACHVLLGMDASGLHGSKLYVGSWSEWCRLHPGAIEPA